MHTHHRRKGVCLCMVWPMILLLLAAFVGGTATFAAFLPYGMLAALMAAPFGGSALCLLAGAVLYALRSYRGSRTAVERPDAAFQPR